MLLGVEDIVRHIHPLEHAGKRLGYFDRNRSHQHRLAGLVLFGDLFDDGVVFLAAGTEDLVFHIIADTRYIRWNDRNIELVDFPEFSGLGFSRAGHAGEFVIHTEIILEGDRGQGLSLGLDADSLLGLDRLVETIGVAPSRQDAAGEFIDDHHLAVLQHVLDVLFVERVSAQELVDSVDLFGSLGVNPVVFIGPLLALLGGEFGVAVEFGQEGGEVRDFEQTLFFLGELLVAEVGEGDGVLAFVDVIIQAVIDLVQLLVAHVGGLDVGDEPLDPALFHEFEQPLVLGSAALGGQKQGATLELIVGFGLLDQLLRLGDHVVDQRGLLADQQLDHRPHLAVAVVDGGVLHLPGDDKRRTGFVDQDRVHFVDDGVVVIAVNAVQGLLGHVVAEVVEPEFVGGAEGDVALVLLPPGLVGHFVLDDAHGEAEEAINLAHPLGVAAGEVVVDGDDMDALAGEGIQVGGEGGDQSLSFAGGHLGDLPLVKRHAPHELDIEMDHIPGGRDIDHIPGLADMTAAGLLDDGKSLGHEVIDRLAIVEPLAEFGRLGLELLVGQLGQCGEMLVDFRNRRKLLLDVAFVLGAEYPGNKILHL